LTHLGRIQSTIKAPAEIVSHAVRLDHVFGLSLRDVELILSEPGILVTHERSRHWRPKFGADFARTLRRRQPQLSIRIRGVLHRFWRAVDQHPTVLDVLKRRWSGTGGQGRARSVPENKRVKFTSPRATKSNAAPNPDD
jgi:transposase-like protein